MRMRGLEPPRGWQWAGLRSSRRRNGIGACFGGSQADEAAYLRDRITGARARNGTSKAGLGRSPCPRPGMCPGAFGAPGRAMRRLTCASLSAFAPDSVCAREAAMPGALGEAFSLPPPSLDRWVGCRGRAAAPTAADHEPFRFQVQDEIVSGFGRYEAGFCAQLTSVGPFGPPRRPGSRGRRARRAASDPLPKPNRRAVRTMLNRLIRLCG